MREFRECGRVQVGVERSVGGKVCVREGICESLRNGFVPARRRVPSCMFGLLSPPRKRRPPCNRVAENRVSCGVLEVTEMGLCQGKETAMERVHPCHP